MGEITVKLKDEIISVDEILQRDIVAFGNSGHIIVPNKHIGKRIKVIVYKE